MYAIFEARRARRDHDPRNGEFDTGARERLRSFDDAGSGHRQGEVEHPGSSEGVHSHSALAWCTNHFGNGQRERDIAPGGHTKWLEVMELRAKRRITGSAKAKTPVRVAMVIGQDRHAELRAIVSRRRWRKLDAVSDGDAVGISVSLLNVHGDAVDGLPQIQVARETGLGHV